MLSNLLVFELALNRLPHYARLVVYILDCNLHNYNKRVSASLHVHLPHHGTPAFQHNNYLVPKTGITYHCHIEAEHVSYLNLLVRLLSAATYIL